MNDKLLNKNWASPIDNKRCGMVSFTHIDNINIFFKKEGQMRKKYFIAALSLLSVFIICLYFVSLSVGKEGKEVLFILSSLGMTIVVIVIGWVVIKMDELPDKVFKVRRGSERERREKWQKKF
ncbi:MAG: hypothetical protein CO001_02615 [Candidatus Portnoybacteria bacterium CG_4_8_14_3_um_filter_40_10]|uniref:Uncharacterized protein n=4 Tax=Candidatus Portnoyibacteriota TaxID=1817913 RepID=A0A2M7II53_9BACT|nr:MAG: hypothetical protein COV84_01435 [Candidatus Portnoybacteria bacterium CG11_big_fil_rev_8_21_14_0_20_40_15]PIS31135.1 MAG: hypothetical protein COT41_02420 [Candidatus Portnoybacteria bacterium CG08_land_8_20_14_0_20_40_83]PIW76210.1 MAG: hypothetical protein CO001_02615 [Candidatus Portnoybacteria bacterium CG_4_8_14_3_um_filter_40_10]PIY74345.1 MAG: hypothetical protein COY85_03565 [Candidatus Portnoybacteria bacterium CG_4_10_14_0_8_um_filter_40_50]PJA64536.1 MAG: hypothetical protei